MTEIITEIEAEVPVVKGLDRKNAVQIQVEAINLIEDERLTIDNYEAEIEDGEFEFEVELVSEKSFKRSTHNEVASDIHQLFIDHPADGVNFSHRTNVFETDEGGEEEE